jgi:hypothetical protein
LEEDYDYAREEVSSAMIELVCLMALLFRKYEINLVGMNSSIKTTCDGILVSCVELLVEIKPRNYIIFI